MTGLPEAAPANFRLLTLPPEILTAICVALIYDREWILPQERTCVPSSCRRYHAGQTTLEYLGQTCKELEPIANKVRLRHLKLYYREDYLLLPRRWQCPSSPEDTAHVKSIEIGPPISISFSPRMLYALNKITQGEARRLFEDPDVLKRLPNLQILAMRCPSANVPGHARLEKLTMARLNHSKLNYTQLQRIFGHSQKIEHFELFQSMLADDDYLPPPSSVHDSDLFTQFVAPVRVTAPETLDCLRPSSQTLRTLAIQGITKTAWINVAPPLTAIQGFPNLRSFAIQYENIDLGSGGELSSPLSTLIRDCHNLEHLFLFGVKVLRPCGFECFARDAERGHFLRLKRITLMAHEDAEDPAKDWVNQLRYQIENTNEGDMWSRKLATVGVQLKVLSASKSLWDASLKSGLDIELEDRNLPGPGWHLEGFEQKLLKRIKSQRGRDT
ncbi:hypothetical protein QBC43DRAFT_338187 [Cladorrhinum sp. PSN259]|nr:hypothetical protein QBC43DRAFT_338187 [Cladorrhinum sp. PSN259]